VKGRLPYATEKDLPTSVSAHLPLHAQQIFRAAFNSAWDEYADRGDERREEIAHRVAWAAVKRLYHKEGSDWVAS